MINITVIITVLNFITRSRIHKAKHNDNLNLIIMIIIIIMIMIKFSECHILFYIINQKWLIINIIYLNYLNKA